MARSASDASVSADRFFQLAVLGLVASGFLAVAGTGRIDLPTVALVSAGLLLRALMTTGIVKLRIPGGVALVTAAACTVFFALDMALLSRNPLVAVARFVFFLAVLRALTASSTRHYAYLAVFAVLELLGGSLLAVDVRFLAALGLYLLFAVAALASAEIRRSAARAALPPRGPARGFHLRLAVLTLMIAGGIFTLTAAMFFVLPRTADAAFSRFARRAILPGFSNNVTLGQIGAVKNSSRPAMHIRVAGGDAAGPLKWRGAALSEFDGRRWSNLDARKTRIRVENGEANLQRDYYTRQRHIEYEITFDALEDSTLFFAGIPEKVDLLHPFVLRTAEDNYSLIVPPARRFHYDAYSALEPLPGVSPQSYPPPVLALREREKYLQLPQRLDPRIPELARSMSGATQVDLEKVRKVEARLRSDYGYTLDLPSQEPVDPVADFLFARMQGHCEYFASAMTLLLRTLDVPARLVTGFQGGEYNPVTELWVVRASDAHAWVEAWIPGYGWSSFDPTPPDPNAHRFAVAAKLSLYLDAAETFWQEWVLGYGARRQGSLAERVEMGAQRAGIRWYDAVVALRSGWRTTSRALAGRTAVIAAAALALGLLLWLTSPRLISLLRWRRGVERVRHGRAAAGDATLLYARMLRVMKRRGHEKPLWFTPAEFARTVPSGPVGDAVAEFTSAYNAMRFGGRMEAAPRMAELLEQLDQRK